MYVYIYIYMYIYVGSESPKIRCRASTVSGSSSMGWYALKYRGGGYRARRGSHAINYQGLTRNIYMYMYIYIYGCVCVYTCTHMYTYSVFRCARRASSFTTTARRGTCRRQTWPPTAPRPPSPRRTRRWSPPSSSTTVGQPTARNSSTWCGRYIYRVRVNPSNPNRRVCVCDMF